jgi:type II secretory pathway component PulM
MIIESCRRRALTIWRHRTKLAGGLGMAAGALQMQLQNHPEVHLPREGTMMMGLGAIVVAIGAYNSLAQFFGWTDPPS